MGKRAKAPIRLPKVLGGEGGIKTGVKGKRAKQVTTPQGSKPTLKLWVPGQVPNPHGKPKGTMTVKNVIKYWLEQQMEYVDKASGKIEKMKVKDAMVLKQMHKAIKKGDTRAFEAILDRVESKAKQIIENMGEVRKIVHKVKMIDAEKQSKPTSKKESGKLTGEKVVEEKPTSGKKQTAAIQK